MDDNRVNRLSNDKLIMMVMSRYDFLGSQALQCW